MARVTCNTVDEAIDAMEKMLCPFRETAGPDDGIKWVPDEWVQIQFDGKEWRRVDDQPLQITAVEEEINTVDAFLDGDAWFLPRNHEASNLTMESLQKAIADMERRKLEHPGVKLTINPTHVEIPVPPGWTREMVEDMMYYQNALSEVSSLAEGPVEERVGIKMFDSWYEGHEEEDQPKEGSMDARRPKAGDVVEYKGALRTVECFCGGGERRYALADHTARLEFFNDGAYNSTCPVCKMWFWFDLEHTVRSGLGLMIPAEDTPAPTESLADVLPDLYGRKEHAAYMERMTQAEREQKMEKASSLGHALGRVMDGLCGKHRGMED